MPIKRTYYEVLDVPRTATPEQIKRRYRRLARQYHPDVAEDKAAAKAAFLDISEAYRTLINPDKRVIYDVSIDAEMFRVQTSRTRASTSAERTGPRARPAHTQPSAASRVAEAQRRVREAQAAFVQGQFRSAVWACKEAQRLDRRNVQAHVILGDIYRIQGQAENAIAMYTVAAQLDPRNTDVQVKLGRLTRHSRIREPGMGIESRAVLKMGLNLMGWSMVAFLFVLLAMSPGEPIAWLQQHLPMVSTWSTMLFAVLLIAGALTGFLLSVNETVEPLDDELVFQVVRSPGPRRLGYPVGLILVLFNFFSFYLAVGVYVVIGLVQESTSKSVLKAFAAVFALALLASVLYAPGRSQVLVFGGNVVFPALLFGWAVGDMFRPGW